MASVAPPVHELIDRVKNLFIEVPGTQLSLAEISRSPAWNRRDVKRYSMR